MTSGRDPPIYICFECFDDNLQQFDVVALAERVSQWLLKMFPELPFVISPLHKPTNSKAHVHGIAEISDRLPYTVKQFFDTFKAYKLPLPQICDSICGAELYLTHDSVQSRIDEKQTFTVAERQTMIFQNGYKLHKQTARDKADSVSVVVSYVSDKIYDYIRDNPFCDTDDLFCLVKTPEFYFELVSELPFSSIVSKGKNEVKVHSRFYMQIAADIKKKYGDKPVTSEYEYFCDSVISNSLKENDVACLRQIHYNIWVNFSPYRQLLANNSCHHNNYARNLRLAVNYFKSNNEHMERIYKFFLEIIRK